MIQDEAIDEPMTPEQAAQIEHLQAEVRQGWDDLAKTVGAEPFSRLDEKGTNAVGAHGND